jgi:hypothetical protein
MMHLNDGRLRASLDQEVTENETLHLADCELCQNRLEVIRNKKERTGKRLLFLSSSPDLRIPAAQYELARLKERVTKKETIMQNIFKVFKNRLVWGGMVTTLLVVAFLSFPTMRAAAAQLLSQFRVQQVTVLPIDPTGLTKLNGDSNLSTQLSQMLSDSVVETKKPADIRTATSAEDASQMIGFQVRLPDNQTDTPKIYVQDSMGYEITIDRAKAQSFINETGRTDIVLPDSVDGKKVSIDIPSGISAAYGTCPDPESDKVVGDPDEPGSLGRNFPECVMMAEIPSPVVSAPEDLDVVQLVELGLEFTGMTSEQAKEYSQTVDWTSTLVIPVPRNAASNEQVEVDGVTGTLIKRPADDAPRYALIWVKDGIIYSIGGWGSDSARAVEMANNLK